MTMLLFTLFACVKNFDISGQLRDTNGKPVQNAIITIPSAGVETRSDEKGTFKVHLQYNKKKTPYIITMKALAHEEKSQDLLLEQEKEKEISKRFILEPKKIFLPYRKINIDVASYDTADILNPTGKELPQETKTEENSQEKEEQTENSENLSTPSSKIPASETQGEEEEEEE